MDDITYVNTVSVEDYLMLRAAAGWRKIKANRAQIGLNNSAFIVAAKHNNQTVGMARVVTDGGYVAYIGDVSVLPEFQGRGIGRTMMQMVMEYINSLLEDGLQIYTILMSVAGKETFYNKFGFITRPDDNYGAGMHRWIGETEELT